MNGLEINKELPVVASGLKKNYGTLSVLKGVSLRIERGEIFGLLGPNGAGKTSLLECILGSRSYDSGSVSLLGNDGRRRNRRLFERIGVQLQASAFPSYIKTGELCRRTACLYKSGGDWPALIGRFGLKQCLKRPVSALSGGELRKLSLVLALIHEPELLFLDELTTGMDPQARREIWNCLLELNGRGVTIFLISHYMDEVSFLCSRAAVLHDGRIAAEGSPSELASLSPSSSLEDSYLSITGGEAVK